HQAIDLLKPPRTLNTSRIRKSVDYSQLSSLSPATKYRAAAQYDHSTTTSHAGQQTTIDYNAILELVKRNLDNSTQHMQTDDTETPLPTMQTDYTDQDYIEPAL
ncbi:unnamed protein product, partial [Ceratitis capitata]